MSLAFILFSVLTLFAAAAALCLRHLVHCALCAAVAFAGLAGLFLQLSAQFVGLAQVLVYVGAVAILIVFAILLTRGGRGSPEAVVSRSGWTGPAVALLVWISLTSAVLLSPVNRAPAAPKPDVSHDVAVERIGVRLMTEYVVALEIVGLLLTAAAIGAVIIAMRERETEP
jgi:NADH-quinone oxidoreductase subunit J